MILSNELKLIIGKEGICIVNKLSIINIGMKE